jgi:glycine cleavage system H protein
MANVRFTSDHEWVRIEDDIGVVGITDYAQEQLGDIVFVELPEVGTQLEKGAEAAVVESVKAAIEVYSPVNGEVVAINEELAEDPGKVNADAMGDGWFFKIRFADPAELDDLMKSSAYKELVAGLK